MIPYENAQLANLHRLEFHQDILAASKWYFVVCCKPHKLEKSYTILEVV